ncbi:MAG: glycosyltransferase [Anaerolineae bacterium]
MHVGILLPGFSSDENDWAIPVQLTLVREMAHIDDVRVITLRYPHRRNSYSIYGATVHALGGAQVRGVKRLKLWSDAFQKIRNLHRQRPFDVLHAMWADETGLIAAWSGKWLGIPVVVSIAGGELVGFHDINYGLQRSAFSRWVVNQALTQADCVIPACSYTAKLITKIGCEVPPENIRTIALGVDTTVLEPQPPNKSTGDKTDLIHVASLVGVKDQQTLLRAVARLDAAVTLTLVGSGPEEARLKELANQLDLANRIRFIGAVHHSEMPHYYLDAAIHVLTSRHEGLGMVTLEAAACGLPTVGTAVGLLPDHNELGITVPVGDDAALASAISNLLRNDEHRRALGNSARDLVQSRFTIQHTLRQFRKLYQDLMQQRTRRKS